MPENEFDSISKEELASAVKLEEMSTPKSALAASLKNQMIADDLAMEVGLDASLEDISSEYRSNARSRVDMQSKAQLDREEKEALRAKVQEQLSAKPQGYNQKRSAEMYKRLMAEKDAKEAKAGFFVLLANALAAGLSAVLIFLLKLNADGTKPYANYIVIAAVIFALMMLVRSNFGRILSAIYFFAQGVFLAVFGLFFYIIDISSSSDEDYMIRIVLFSAAVILSIFPAVMLLVNKKIRAYYNNR